MRKYYKHRARRVFTLVLVLAGLLALLVDIQMKIQHIPVEYFKFVSAVGFGLCFFGTFYAFLAFKSGGDYLSRRKAGESFEEAAELRRFFKDNWQPFIGLPLLPIAMGLAVVLIGQPLHDTALKFGFWILGSMIFSLFGWLKGIDWADLDWVELQQQGEA